MTSLVDIKGQKLLYVIGALLLFVIVFLFFELNFLKKGNKFQEHISDSFVQITQNANLGFAPTVLKNLQDIKLGDENLNKNEIIYSTKDNYESLENNGVVSDATLKDLYSDNETKLTFFSSKKHLTGGGNYILKKDGTGMAGTKKLTKSKVNELGFTISAFGIGPFSQERAKTMIKRYFPEGSIVKITDDKYLVVVETEGYSIPVKHDSQAWGSDIDMNDCTEPFYVARNGVTIKAKPCTQGDKFYEWKGERWYVPSDDLSGRLKILTLLSNNEIRGNRIVTTKMTSMNELFKPIPYYSFFEDYLRNRFNEDISNWDISNVTTMYGMFYGTKAFNQPLDKWDTSKVETMRFMFEGAEAFNQDISNWNTSNVRDMWGMFRLTKAFNQPLDKWNVSNVTNMRGMFEGAEAFNQPLNNWNTSNVTNMGYMFRLTKSFNQPLNNWDTSNVTNMEWMFHLSKAFNQNISNWNVNKVTSSRWFAEAAPQFLKENKPPKFR